MQEDEHARRSGHANLMMTVEEACFIANSIMGNEISIDPITYYDAVNHPTLGEQWRSAVDKELNNLIARNTWVFDTLPPGRKALGHKWVFKTKRNPDGTIERRKARLVVGGHRHSTG